jgi:hypothetical protein
MEPKLRDWGKDEFGKCFAIREKVGGRGRDRTGDPLLAKQVLSQLSYTPTIETTLSLKHFPQRRYWAADGCWLKSRLHNRIFFAFNAFRMVCNHPR